ncbi:hypothetical protein CQY20_12680 [Mycolicibacterium agri]|nr:hypothetical protein CQY20_12680 [Mycolicibacterium agri]
MQANLLEVFNERDDAKRRATVERTYAAQVRWTDDEGVTTGRDELEAKCVSLQNNLGALQFVADGSVRELAGFGQLAWQLVDPADGQPRMTGFDVALIGDGVITDLYTVLIPPS